MFTNISNILNNNDNIFGDYYRVVVSDDSVVGFTRPGEGRTPLENSPVVEEILGSITLPKNIRFSCMFVRNENGTWAPRSARGARN